MRRAGFSHFLLSARRASSRARCSSSALLSLRFSSSFSSLFVVHLVCYTTEQSHTRKRATRAHPRAAASQQPASNQQITLLGAYSTTNHHTWRPHVSRMWCAQPCAQLVNLPPARCSQLNLHSTSLLAVRAFFHSSSSQTLLAAMLAASLAPLFFFVFLTVLRRDSILSTKSANSPSTRRRHKINCFASSRSSSAVRRALDAFSHPFSAVVLSRILGTYSAGRASKRTVMLRPPSSALSS